MNARWAVLSCLTFASGAWAADPPLIAAIKNGQLASVQSLLASGQSAGVADAHGYTAVMYALTRADAPTVSSLLAHGGTLPPDSPAFTPLIEAAKAGKADVIQLLIAKGANLEARDAQGATALIWAVGRGRADAAAALIKAGENANARDSRGQTALISACQLGLKAMVTQLLAVPGLKLDERDRLGYTALMWAAHNGQAELVRTLLGRGADPKVKGKDGQTAADIAKARGFAAIAQSLPAD